LKEIVLKYNYTIALSAFVVAMPSIAAPLVGQISSGSASIIQTGLKTTITQATKKAIFNWQSFNIESGQTVQFIQPDINSVALNRIVGNDPTRIFGRLQANGQVYLINPNGILFAQSSQVNVGGLVASTLNITDSDFLAGKSKFTGQRSGLGAVTNQGNIQAPSGYIALLGGQVSNQGTLSARLGTVAMASGNEVNVSFEGSKLLDLQVSEGAIKALAENRELIQADGGKVIMSAIAREGLLDAVVNNSGVIEARTIDKQGGTIKLIADLKGGTVNVGGRLDASAPENGNGGFVETSGAKVKVQQDGVITTSSTQGNSGLWLIDPTDYTVSPAGGDISGSTLSSNLALGSVTILSTHGSVNASGQGDININDSVNWSNTNTLTLNAYRNIYINRPISATSGKFSLLFGQGSMNGVISGEVSSYNVNAAVNLPAGPNFSIQLGSSGTVKNYTVITNLGVAGDTTTSTLQGIHNSQGSFYALGADINASDTINWNGGLGFMPVNVGGALEGLGHVVSNLTINRPTASSVGMISGIYQSAVVSNIGLSGGSIVGDYDVGGLIGMAATGGSVRNSFNSAAVTGTQNVGGLVGRALSSNTISTSYNSGVITGYSNVGGLIGRSESGLQLSKSFNLGRVTTTAPTSFYYGNAGGLVGSASGANIADVFNLGSVQSTNSAAVIGGVIGDATDNSMIQRSYNNAVVSGRDSIGGIAGYNRSGSNIFNSYNLGTIYAEFGSGGIVGYNYAGFITNSFNSGPIGSGTGTAGGIVGNNTLGIVIDSYWNSEVASRGTYFGNPNWGSHNLEGLARNVRAMTSSEMIQSNNYTASQNGGTPLWDFSIWYASGSSLPILRSSPFVATASFGGTQTYGSVNPSTAVSYANMWSNDSLIVSGLTLSTVASGSSGVGDYAITGTSASATNLATGLNYKFIFTPGQLSILQAPLSVTAAAKSKIYGAADPALTYTYSGLVNGDANTVLTGSLTRTAGENVGDYSITQGTVSAGSNYTVSYSGSNLSIGTAPLSVTAAAKSKIYGAADPALTYTYSGLVNGDAASAIAGSLSRAVGENVGSYAISQGTVSAGSNYSINYTGADLLVIPKPLFITNTSRNTTYDGVSTYANLANSTSFSAGAMAGSDAVGSVTQTTGLSGVAQAGFFTVTPSAAILSSGNASNYNFTYLPSTHTVDKASLIVTANNASKSYDGMAYSGGNGITYSGFVNNETSTVLGGVLGYSGSSQGATNAGGYLIVPVGIASPNYNLNYIAGSLTINPSNIIIVPPPSPPEPDPEPVSISISGSIVGAVSKVYNGNNLATLANSNYSLIGFANGEGATITKTEGVYDSPSVGASKLVTVDLQLGDFKPLSNTNIANYIWPTRISGNVGVITKAPMTVNANNANKIFNGLAYVGGNGVVISGYVNGESSTVLTGSLSYVGSSQGARDAGSYAITPTGLTSNNYSIAFNSGSLIVNKAPLSVTAEKLIKPFTANDPMLTYTVSGLASTDKLSQVVSGQLSRVPGEVLGLYAVNQGSLTANSNYEVQFTNGSVQIVPGVLSTASSVFPFEDKAFRISIKPIVPSIQLLNPCSISNPKQKSCYVSSIP
jgi:filamentous hemagglutinin family protein